MVEVWKQVYHTFDQGDNLIVALLLDEDQNLIFGPHGDLVDVDGEMFEGEFLLDLVDEIIVFPSNLHRILKLSVHEMILKQKGYN